MPFMSPSTNVVTFGSSGRRYTKESIETYAVSSRHPPAYDAESGSPQHDERPSGERSMHGEVEELDRGSLFVADEDAIREMQRVDSHSESAATSL